MELKKIVLAGGTGFLGQAIIKEFDNGHTQLVVLTRGGSQKHKNISYLHWDGVNVGGWVKEIDHADVLINLTGKSVNCRYNQKNKEEIIRSRVDSTNVLAQAVKQLQSAPKLWINASSATIYRDSEDKEMDEYTGEVGSGFSVDVCKQWEAAFNKADVPGTRKLMLRISMVLGHGGGIIPEMKGLVKKGLGGKMGSGNQYMSWIHESDFLAALRFLIENEKAEGAFNITSPNPIRNKDFMALMRKIMNQKFGLPATKWMLEIGAVFLKTETELILKSRRVVPARLLKEGFTFKYATVDQAFKNLLTS